MFTEHDFCDEYQDEGWRPRSEIPTVRDTAYALAKVECERFFADAAAASG